MKRQYQPSKIKRKRAHGFRKRMKAQGRAPGVAPSPPAGPQAHVFEATMGGPPDQGLARHQRLTRSSAFREAYDQGQSRSAATWCSMCGGARARPCAWARFPAARRDPPWPVRGRAGSARGLPPPPAPVARRGGRGPAARAALLKAAWPEIVADWKSLAVRAGIGNGKSSPKFRVQSPTSHVPRPKSGKAGSVAPSNVGHETPDVGRGTWDRGLRTWDLGPGTLDFGGPRPPPRDRRDSVLLRCRARLAGGELPVDPSCSNYG